MEFIRLLLIGIVLLLILFPLVYIFTRETRSTGGAIVAMDNAQTEELEHDIRIRVVCPRWPPKFYKTLLTPRFDVTVENYGLHIEHADIILKRVPYEAKVRQPDSFTEIVENYFASKNLRDFSPGDTKRFRVHMSTSTVEMNTLYRIDVIFAKSGPDESLKHQTLKPLFYYWMGDAFEVFPSQNLWNLFLGYTALIVALLAVIFILPT